MEGIHLAEPLPVWAQRMLEEQKELLNRCTLLENTHSSSSLASGTELPTWAQQLRLDVDELKMWRQQPIGAPTLRGPFPLTDAVPQMLSRPTSICRQATKQRSKLLFKLLRSQQMRRPRQAKENR